MSKCMSVNRVIMKETDSKLNVCALLNDFEIYNINVRGFMIDVLIKQCPC